MAHLKANRLILSLRCEVVCGDPVTAHWYGFSFLIVNGRRQALVVMPQ